MKKISLKIVPLFGTPFIEIIREVLRENHDLVITGTEEHGGLRQRLFGSTTMHLMRKCPCPVWVIKPSRKRKYATILAAIDVMVSESGEDELNRKIIELSSSLAGMEGGKLHILHCWSQPLESAPSRYTNLSKERIAEIVAETQKLHKQSFNKFIEGFNLKNISYQTHLLKGKPGQVITEFVNKRRVDLVVMGTLSRAGIPGFLIGNTAEKVLSDISASVLTVKPEAFQTPIDL
jgi:nucleotide-binding universal stress UspA family protein